MALVACCVLLLFARAGSAQSILKAYRQNAPAVVYVRIDHQAATGIIIKSDSSGSLVLTVLHAEDPKVAVHTFYVYRTIDGPTELEAQNPRGDPSRDLLLLSVPKLQNMPVACLGKSAIPGALSGLASYSVSPRDVDPVTGKPKQQVETGVDEARLTFPIVHEANIAGYRSALDGEIEFNASVEDGYSGAPLFDSRTGLVVGIVQRSLTEPTKNSDVPIASASTQFARSPLSLENFLNVGLRLNLPFTRISDDAAHPDSYARFPYPDLDRAGRVVVISRDPTTISGNASDAKIINVVSRSLETVLTRTIARRLGASVARIALTSDDAALRMPRYTAELVTAACLDRNANGALLVYRTVALKGAAAVTVSTDLEFRNCDGSALRVVTMPPATLARPTPLDSQLTEYRNLLGSALDSVEMPALANTADTSALTGGSRLTEFAVHGLLIGNRERQAFLSVRRTSDGRLLTDALYTHGFAAQAAHVPSNVEIKAVGSKSGTELMQLRQDDIDRMINDAGDLGVEVELASGARYHVVAKDRCYYFNSIANSVWKQF